MNSSFRKFRLPLTAIVLLVFASQSDAWAKVGCSAYIEKQCDSLYSSAHNGEMDVWIENQAHHIGFGTDRKSGLATAEIKSFAAIEDNLDRLPSDFVHYLHKYGALKAVRKYLHSREDTDLRFKKFQKQDDLSTVGNTALSQAFTATLNYRFNKRHPNYNREKHWPADWTRERNGLSHALTAEISAAKWENSDAWKKIRTEFEDVRNIYIDLITKDPDPALTAALRNQWISDLKSVKLVVPRTETWTLETCEDDTTENAVYNGDDNQFTVCAGLFNSSGTLFTIAHELGHLLGIGRATILKSRSTQVFARIINLRKNLCESRQLTCSTEWKNFKSTLAQDLNSYDGFTAPKEKLRECLMTKEVSAIDPDKLKEIRDQELLDWSDSLATNQGFTSATVEKLPDDYKGDVKEMENPSYFNPCYPHKADDVTRISPSASTLLFYLNEYLCQPASLDEATKMKNAITVSTSMSRDIWLREVALGGKFSESSTMEANGFSEDVDEKYADYMAGKVSAVILGRLKNPEDRRTRFFYDMALFCTKREASLVDLYPGKTSAEKTFSTEPHPLDNARRKRLFMYPELRQVLDCEKDFDITDCNES